MIGEGGPCLAARRKLLSPSAAPDWLSPGGQVQVDPWMGTEKSRAPHSLWLARIEWTAQKKRQQLRPGRGEGSNAVGVPHPNSIKDPTTSSRPKSEPHCPASASHARSAPVFFTANHLRYKSIDRSQLTATNCIARSFKAAYIETIRLGSSRFVTLSSFEYVTATSQPISRSSQFILRHVRPRYRR